MNQLKMNDTSRSYAVETPRNKRIRNASDTSCPCGNEQSFTNSKKTKLIHSNDEEKILWAANNSTTCVNFSISCLNQSGATKMLCSNCIDEAEQYFLDAVALLPQLQASETFACNIVDDTLTINSFPDDEGENFNMELDEGISPDSAHPILIKSTDSVSTTASILMYNIGLTYNRRRKFKQGLLWFERSFAFASSNKNEMNSTVSVRVLHAIGLCNYRLQKH